MPPMKTTSVYMSHHGLSQLLVVMFRNTLGVGRADRLEQRDESAKVCATSE